jgi:hypothetical protein
MSKRLARSYVFWLLVLSFSTAVTAGMHSAFADDDQWVIGKWELSYDPDGAKTDWLIFKPNGDVISRGQDGTEYTGMYIVTPEGVKTVFTHEGQDVIATFHADERRQALKIVTSRSGKESIYKKVE